MYLFAHKVSIKMLAEILLKLLHISANFATCSWELLTMLNPHFVVGEHGLGGHKSEDIRTFYFCQDFFIPYKYILYYIFPITPLQVG